MVKRIALTAIVIAALLAGMYYMVILPEQVAESKPCVSLQTGSNAWDADIDFWTETTWNLAYDSTSVYQQLEIGRCYIYHEKAYKLTDIYTMKNHHQLAFQRLNEKR